MQKGKGLGVARRSFQLLKVCRSTYEIVRDDEIDGHEKVLQHGNELHTKALER